MPLIDAIKSKKPITYIEQLIQNDKNILVRIDPELRITPLMFAMKNENLQIMKLLIKKYNDHFTYDPPSKYIIWETLQYAQEYIFKFVIKNIKNSKNLNDTYDNNGSTLLHLACKRGLISICNYLIENGANPLHKNNQGKSAKTIALLEKNYEIYMYLNWIEIDIYQSNQNNTNQKKLYLKIYKMLIQHNLETISVSILLEKLIKQKTYIEKQQEDDRYLNFQSKYDNYAYLYLDALIRDYSDSDDEDLDDNDENYDSDKIDFQTSPYHQSPNKHLFLQFGEQYQLATELLNPIAKNFIYLYNINLNSNLNPNFYPTLW